ncbi:nuclear RNA export factor 3 [Delphinapterus leucas]|uniref:Nuclear RNA export factor 3 n=1 Tax=Delphinapterus leucas TaxID=9749 RepID=A0A7F8K8C0_DELLE|nr:nuclear RNA export factor 3 [Delphinapterus leucas]
MQENIDQVNTLQRKARCRGIYRRRHNYWSQQATSQQQQDRESLRSDAHVDTQARYAPYAIPSCHRRGNFQEQDETHVNKETEQKPPERRMERNRQDETLGSWFKIRIPFGIKYDEKWLLNLIQKQCSVPFTPVEFHYEKMQAQFFVENANIAFALKNVNGKIYNEANERISIFVDPCDAPHSVLKELRSEKVEQIKLSMKEQYDASQQSLDIQRVRSDPDLMTPDTGMARNPRTGMAASLQIHPGNMPKVSVPHSGKRGRKQGLIKAHLLTKARERKGYSSHSKNVWGVPAAAEASRMLPQCEVRHAFSSGSWPRIAGSSAVAGCTGSQEVVGSDPCLHTGSLLAVAAVVVSSCGVRDNSRDSLPPLELT